MSTTPNNYNAFRHEVGQVIRECREEEKWSQYDLAKAAGMQQATISYLENGKVDCKLDTLVRIADAMGYSIEIKFNARDEEAEAFDAALSEVFA